VSDRVRRRDERKRCGENAVTVADLERLERGVERRRSVRRRDAALDAAELGEFLLEFADLVPVGEHPALDDGRDPFGLRLAEFGVRDQDHWPFPPRSDSGSGSWLAGDPTARVRFRDVSRHDGAGGDERSPPDCHPWEDRRVRADRDVILEDRPLEFDVSAERIRIVRQDGLRSEKDVIADRTLRGNVRARLETRVRADGRGPSIVTFVPTTTSSPISVRSRTSPK